MQHSEAPPQAGGCALPTWAALSSPLPSGLHRYKLRLVFEVVDLPPALPAVVNHHEARAYANWLSAKQVRWVVSTWTLCRGMQRVWLFACQVCDVGAGWVRFKGSHVPSPVAALTSQPTKRPTNQPACDCRACAATPRCAC